LAEPLFLSGKAAKKHFTALCVVLRGALMINHTKQGDDIEVKQEFF
jgi:hypothetical protein